MTVTVLDENGDPAPFVYVYEDGGFNGGFTDDAGEVTLLDLPTGPTTLLVDDFTLGSGSVVTTVVANSTVTATINLTAPVFVAVNITVEDTNGDPVPGLDVYIDGGFFNSAVTDANGVAAFDAIPTGLRNVYVATFTPIFVEYATAVVDVQSDPTNETIVIPKPAFGDVEVLVVDDVAAIPCRSVRVTCCWTAFTQLQRAHARRRLQFGAQLPPISTRPHAPPAGSRMITVAPDTTA